MMAGNPSWWSMHPLQQQQPSSAAFLSASSPAFFPPQYVLGSSNNSPSLPFNSFPADHNQEQLPQSWSQLLLGGLTGEEDRFGQQQLTHHFQHKKLENWAEDQILNSNNNPSHGVLSAVDHVKQELISQNSTNNQLYSDEEFQAALRPVAAAAACWTQVAVNMPASSPRSCVTSLSSTSNILDFSYNQTTTDHHGRNNNTINQLPDQSSECNSTATGGVCKKARVQSSSNQPPLKVRKEKLGDRITALHQLVSPFGKTDTASVLLEAIGYIRFLQSQIEALSSPYMASNMRNHNPHSVQGERSRAFPEEQSQDGQGDAKDLRSRGLCLVPVSFTQHVGSENGADYWSPAIVFKEQEELNQWPRRLPHVPDLQETPIYGDKMFVAL